MSFHETHRRNPDVDSSEIATYLAGLLRQAVVLARRCDFSDLAYLIDMARLEAEEQAGLHEPVRQ